MELLKIISRSSGGDQYVDNAVSYLLDERGKEVKGYGVDINSAESAATAFKQVADYWGNSDKNPVLHGIASFTKETATTLAAALELTEKIMQPLTEEHLALSVAHNEKRSNSSFHTHTVISTTNMIDGSMISPTNATTYSLAQRMADVTGEPVTLIVENDKKSEWECPHKFYPHKDDSEG